MDLSRSLLSFALLCTCFIRSQSFLIRKRGILTKKITGKKEIAQKNENIPKISIVKCEKQFNKCSTVNALRQEVGWGWGSLKKHWSYNF